MAGYNTIKGLRVKYLSADPSNAEDGQVWYNSTTGNLRVQGVGVSAWSSASPLSGSARYGVGSLGSQTANVIAGGSTVPFGIVTEAEEYNGSGWTSLSSIGTARYFLAGAGTNTAGVIFGGNYPARKNETEEWNGSSWSEQNNLNTARRLPGGSGSQTDALATAGDQGPSGNVTADVEEYNGTSWSEQNNIPTALRGGCSAGTASSNSMFFGGYTGTARVSSNYEYDGTNWTTGGSLNTARNGLMGSGTQTSGLAFGGQAPSATTATEFYNGTSWTNVSSMGTAAYTGGGSVGAGTGTAALQSTGRTPPISSATEEYNFSTSTITPSVWSSGGTMPSSANQKNGSGILTAAFAVGGETPPGAVENTSVSYNGTSWTATNNINSARADVMSGGTLTAGLIMGGFQNVPDPNFLFDETEEYNGTSWSEVNNMPTGAYSGSGTGTQTAAFVNNMYIGSPGERTNVTYEYDGTNWSSGGNTAETTNSRSSVGTLTAGLTVGGRPAPATFISDTELYNGTSWTAGVDMLQPFQAGGQSSKGTQTSCIIFGSPKSPVNTLTYEFDGTSWFTQPNLGTYQNNGTGTATSALAFGVSNTSQEWQAGSTTENPARNITTS